jgi:hypothetical protein
MIVESRAFLGHQLGTTPMLRTSGLELRSRKIIDGRGLVAGPRSDRLPSLRDAVRAISSGKRRGDTFGGDLGTHTEGFWFPSTTRGPITVNFAFAAICSDALRCAGMRSSGGLWRTFTAITRVQNPVGDSR